MPLFPNLRREEIVAPLAAIALVAAGTTAWLRRDAATEERAARTPRRSLDTPLTDHGARRAGELSNGLHFVVRANQYPEKRAELRLVVNAGSVMEMEDQRGLAHAVEHMLFRGTEHFPGRTIPNYLESIGMRSGQDINASTDQDETIYRFTVPTDRAEVVDSAIAMLADMASRATFDSTEARTEGGIVLAEWRSRHDAGYRLGELRDSMMFEHSRYAKRPTAGDTTVLRRFDVGAMRRFYQDWYRPELMSVVVVGDVDPLATMLSIKRHFNGIPASTTPRTRPSVSAPRVHAVRAVALTDSEATGVRLSIFLPRPAERDVRLGDYREHLVRQLWREVLEARLQDAADEPGSPLLSASVDGEDLVRPVDAEVVSASIVDGSAPLSLDMMVEEMTRLARHGPTAHELHQVAGAMLHRRADAAQWSDQSDDLADNYVEEFLRGSAPIDRDAAYALATELLPSIGIADLTRAARAVSLDSGALVVAIAPTARALTNLSPPELIARARTASTRDVERKHQSIASTRLMAQPPEPGHIASERIIPEIDGFEWTLANGMHVILKPTNYTNEQFEFRLVATGGASLASDADYPSAFLADGVVRTMGVGPVSGRQLSQLLEGSSIDWNQSVTDESVSITGYGAPREIETLFQLLHLHFTAPRVDSAAFRRYRERTKAFAANRRSDPDAILDDSVEATIASHHRRALRTTPRFYDDVDLSRSLAFWNARMANAANFTLVLTGDFTLDLVRPYVERYLASLPKGAREQPLDDGVRFPPGIVRKDLYVGAGPKARTELVFSGPFDGSFESAEALARAVDVAEVALEERLRETLGATYGVNVNSEVRYALPMSYQIHVSFDAAPERIDTLADAALAELTRLRSSGPTKSEVDKVRAAKMRDLENTESNVYWANELSGHSRMGWSLATIAAHPESAKQLAMAGLRQACARILDTSHYVRVTMYPKSYRRP